MEKSNIKYSKYCLVPMCQSTTIKTPEKIFVSLPVGSSTNLKKKRKLWLNAMKRKETDLSENTRGFVCEDHFNLKEDMENYTRFKFMGGNVRFKSHVVPHIFKCQIDGKKHISSSQNSATKKAKKASEDIIKEMYSHEKNYIPTPASQTSKIYAPKNMYTAEEMCNNLKESNRSEQKLNQTQSEIKYPHGISEIVIKSESDPDHELEKSNEKLSKYSDKETKLNDKKYLYTEIDIKDEPIEHNSQYNKDEDYLQTKTNTKQESFEQLCFTDMGNRDQECINTRINIKVEPLEVIRNNYAQNDTHSEIHIENKVTKHYWHTERGTPYIDRYQDTVTNNTNHDQIYPMKEALSDEKYLPARVYIKEEFFGS